jgi:hypothetical protein
MYLLVLAKRFQSEDAELCHGHFLLHQLFRVTYLPLQQHLAEYLQG